MINFSGLSNSSLLGRAARLPLRLIPRDAEVRILQGPLRGKRWITGSFNHGCWLGSYEIAKQKKMVELVRPGMVCWDVGAHVGFYTLLFAELVGPQGKVFAFEPVSSNLALLRRHVEMNGYMNVRIVPCALADFDGEAEFDPGPNTSMGRIAAGGLLKVPVRSADSLIRSGTVSAPDIVKRDVEGAEAAVLRGAEGLLKSGRSMWFIATHGLEPHRASLDILGQLGWHVESLDGSPAGESSELVAFPPGCGA